MNELQIIKQSYERIQKVPNYGGRDFEKFLRETVCRVIFNENSLFCDYTRSILFWYSDQFKTEEFKTLFDNFFVTAKRLAQELEKEFNLSEDECREIEEKPNILPTHPFHENCGLLVNARNREALPEGKELWLQILKQTQEKNSYFNPWFKQDSLEKRVEWSNRCILALEHFLNVVYHRQVKKGVDNAILDELSAKSAAISNYFELQNYKTDSPTPDTFCRYLRLFHDYYLFDLHAPENWFHTDEERKSLQNYFRSRPIFYDKFLREEMRVEMSFELLLQDLDLALLDGKIKKNMEPIEGKITIDSPIKLRFKGKPDHIMYRKKVPSVICELAQKNEGKFLLKEVLKRTQSISDKLAKKAIQDFREGIKDKFDIKTIDPLISITDQKEGETIIFDPRFWIWE